MSTKEYEKVRQEMAKKYKIRLEEERKKVRELQKENEERRTQNIQLETKVSEQKEWITRLLEYTELTPDEAKNLLVQSKVAKEIDDLCDGWSKLFAHTSLFR